MQRFALGWLVHRADDRNHAAGAADVARPLKTAAHPWDPGCGRRTSATASPAGLPVARKHPAACAPENRLLVPRAHLADRAVFPTPFPV